MKIVAWVGNQSNQKALVNKINLLYPLAGIITETPIAKRKLTIKKIALAVIEKIVLKKPAQLWWSMLKYYDDKYKAFPAVQTINVENINSDEAFEFTKALKPDLIIVSGTRLVRKKMLSLTPSTGIINLHTGLSPYIKGGPNCTNWCIATQQFHLIGNTIMWLDAGIDTGNLITTELTEVTGNESLEELHIKVMEHAHDLYVRSIDYLEKGGRNNVKQNSITAGTTYYNKQWTLTRKYQLLKCFKNFKRAVQSPAYIEQKKNIITVPLLS